MNGRIPFHVPTIHGLFFIKDRQSVPHTLHIPYTSNLLLLCVSCNGSFVLPLCKKLLGTQNIRIYVLLYACVLYEDLHHTYDRMSLHNHHTHRQSYLALLFFLCVRLSNVTLVQHRLWMGLALCTLCICFLAYVASSCAIRDGVLTWIFFYKVHGYIHTVLFYMIFLVLA